MTAAEDRLAEIPPGALSFRERARYLRADAQDRAAFEELAARRVREFEADMFPPRRRRPERTYQFYCGNFDCPSRIADVLHEVRESELPFDPPYDESDPESWLPVDDVWFCPACRPETNDLAARPRSPRQERKVQCWQCDEWFGATRSGARYCSAVCRQRASRARSRRAF